MLEDTALPEGEEGADDEKEVARKADADEPHARLPSASRVKEQDGLSLRSG